MGYIKPRSQSFVKQVVLTWEGISFESLENRLFLNFQSLFDMMASN